MGSCIHTLNMKLLVFVIGVASAATILEYKDAEAGLSHTMSGQPGTQVEGEFEFDSPEGDKYKVQYTAGEAGFEAMGAHLPVHVEDTEAVAAARSSFMQAFMEAEAEMEMEEMMEEVSNYMDPIADVMEARSLEVETNRRKRSPVTAGVPQTISAAPLAQTLNYNIPLYNAAAAAQYIPTVYQTPLGSPEPVVSTVGNPLVRQVAGNPVFQIGFQGLQPVVGAPLVPGQRTLVQGDEEPAALAL